MKNAAIVLASLTLGVWFGWKFAKAISGYRIRFSTTTSTVALRNATASPRSAVWLSIFRLRSLMVWKNTASVITYYELKGCFIGKALKQP